MRTFKLPEPDDYKEIQDFSIRVEKAYTECSVELLKALTTIKVCAENIESNSTENASIKEILNKFIKPFKI